MSLEGFQVLISNRDYLFHGLLVTLEVSVLGIALATLIGTVIGILRTYGGPVLAALLSVYVDVFRSIPLLVILVWLFFVPPLLAGVTLSPFPTAVVGLGLHSGAYMAEIVRGGLGSVRAGQTRAALALGMTRWQAIRRIVLPQALIRMLPPIGSLFAVTIKDSALAGVIAVEELLRQSQVLASQTFRPFEIFTVVMIAYFLVIYPVARGVDYIYRRLAALGSS